MNRTGSMGSRVAPAVTSTFFPAISLGKASSRRMYSKSTHSSGIRPSPESPLASIP